ncbi:hypothetical protein EST62_07980 [Chlorobaculum sp. 24CR]|uniref:hypothetical protein n=1 Tax=Chlorobaculum sp. 24CR TaxID=2508878 RepID=UPI00100A4364|nr:hypothetical protein [Chlorobaculum sp. 24CR]RXK84988.1 hypothetical protein EST62_07980 [Chlorobaculum sp. 24CR]
MKHSFARLKSLMLLFLFSQLFAACASRQSIVDHDALKQQYRAAVADAAVAEPSEISRNLVAIVPSNERLIWKNRNDSLNTRVLVVTWTNYNGYDDKVGQPVTVSREIWVTTVPEVKNFCKQHEPQSSLRLEQLLGLPPNNGKTRFVEMWVRPADLYRPSADPEITDSEAETDFRTPNKFIEVSDEFKKWYNDLKAQSYGENGYPWTRLGYTYDWGKEKNHVGMSEFVILPNSTVEINSVSSTGEYEKSN